MLMWLLCLIADVELLFDDGVEFTTPVASVRKRVSNKVTIMTKLEISLQPQTYDRQSSKSYMSDKHKKDPLFNSSSVSNSCNTYHVTCCMTTAT